MKAEIISVGTELLLGTIVDTNASYLAQRLAQLGADCYHISQVGDNQARIVEALRDALSRSELVVTTGGLGPTGDDLTRESIAELLGETPFVVPELERDLRGFFARRNVAMPERNLKQATLIPSAQVLPNPVGTAPGWLVRYELAGSARYIVSMPGVPFEMKRMWEQEVEPWLRPLSPHTLVSKTLKTMGLGESTVDQLAGDLTKGSNPTVAPYAKPDGVYLRITAKAASAGEAMALIEPVEQELRKRLGSAVYGVDDETPADSVKHLLAACGFTLALLEIGGEAIGALSVQLSGYAGLGPVIASSSLQNAAKLLSADGARQTLAELSNCLRERSAADLVLAISVDQKRTSEDSVHAKAQILVVTGVADNETEAEPHRSAWTTSSSEIRRLAGLAALNHLRKWLLENNGIEGSLKHAV